MNDGEVTRLEELAEALIDDHDRLREALVGRRKAQRLTQAEVGERMGVSQPAVANFERYDANPTLSSVRRYALAVGARIETNVSDDGRWARSVR